MASAGNIDDDSYDDILIGAKIIDSLGVNKAVKYICFEAHLSTLPFSQVQPHWQMLILHF